MNTKTNSPMPCVCGATHAAESCMSNAEVVAQYRANPIGSAAHERARKEMKRRDAKIRWMEGR